MEEAGKTMTDEERLALAAKLDDDLDDFISGLERKQYTDGWPEDRWQEEMEKHPFFMKKHPEPGEELHPLYEGMQAIKFDPAENTKQELADNYKEDGKFYITHKKYRMAVMSYTEALKFKLESDDYNAVLYNNRSAANFFLKNYRSSLVDAEKAFKLKPDYQKPRWRAAQCASFLNRFDLCIEICDEILKIDPTNVKALELRKSVVDKKTTKARDERKLASQEKKKQERIERTLIELKKRSVKFEESKALQNVAFLKPKLAPLEDFMVYANENGILYWPSVFCYPEFCTTDFQQQLCEDVTMDGCLNSLLQEPLPYDTQLKYHPTKLNIYYENRVLAKAYKLDTSKTIKEIVKEKTFLIYNGTLTFYVVVKDSRAEKDFLDQTRLPIRLNQD